MLPPLDLRFDREEFTIEVGLYGYLIKYRGKTIGGAGLSTCSAADFQSMADFEIRAICCGELGRYEPALRQIRRLCH
jgi:hypothetical protein